MTFLTIDNRELLKYALTAIDWCEYEFYSQKLEWHEASQVCQMNGKTLLKITDIQQHNSIKSYYELGTDALDYQSFTRYLNVYCQDT